MSPFECVVGVCLIESPGRGRTLAPATFLVGNSNSEFIQHSINVEGEAHTSGSVGARKLE